ncbi:MAG TPA: von Willebrand factor type A domain-containing protein, partial [Pirellulales bacterium]|nr:von Willebrand factor type A domain-containing protein [Pirellulales bacterium]
MNDQHTLRDDFEDRLAEQALGELLGGRRPPDLSERNLAAAAATRPVTADRWASIFLAVAASMLVLATLGGAYCYYRIAADSAQVAAVDSSGSVAEGLVSESAGRSKIVRGSNDSVDSPDQLAPVTDWDRLTKFRREADEAEAMIGGVPALDGPPIEYPDPETWQRLAVRRKRYQAIDQGGGQNESRDSGRGAVGDGYFVGVQYPEGRADPGPYVISVSSTGKDSGDSIEQRLKRPVKVKFQNNSAPIPLRNALAQLGEQVDLNLRLESEALGNAPVKLELTQEISAKSALALIFDSFGMSVTFENDRIRVAKNELADQGRGPGEGGDRYSRIIENPFLGAAQNPLSTFSIDVDTASYAKVRRYLLEENRLPP